MSRMKYIVLWLMLAAGLGAQAANIDFRHSGASTNGYYYWSDPANWSGDISIAANTARFGRTMTQSKVYLDGNVGPIQSLIVYTNSITDIAGAGIITIAGNASSWAGPNAALILRDSVRITVNSAFDMILNAGSPTLTLYDNARVDAGLRFINPGTQFIITLNGNSVFDNQGTPNTASSIAAGSMFVLNNNGSMMMSDLTAQEMNDNWFAYNTRIYLNNSASITLEANAANTANIASYIEAGKLWINGSTNAVINTDYTYDAGTGILQVIPEPATAGLFGLAGIACLLLRRHRMLR